MNSPISQDTPQISSINVSNHQLLEKLVVENEDLERLESLLDRFNIFEATGSVRHELRHSDFLAYLLDPRMNHGLGEVLLVRLLQEVIRSATITVPNVTALDLELWNLGGSWAMREWRGIDILVVSENNDHKLVVLIENKIDSGEHSNQLERYHEIIDQHYKEHSIIPIFLTPNGEEPSDKRYLPLSYTTVCQVIERVAENRRSTLGAEVYTLMAHYTEMLRRHIMSESEIAKLCERIYRKHQRALDLIYEYRPNKQAQMRDFLERFLRERAPDLGLVLYASSQGRLRFGVIAWDTSLLKAVATNENILWFEISDMPLKVQLKLVIGSGDENIRQRLLDTVLSHKVPFSGDPRLYATRNTIYSVTLASGQICQDEMEVIETTVVENWNRFAEVDLKVIRQVIESQEWLFQSGDPA